ncbi:DNA-binding anti-repressor SinI [Paenibacillus hodogayensis]|uniref:DNA-binding anti-repressor SinI n=1 Tax=Paenibacillus hodogayensis TaxID=279208 RepID=A0ABV5VZX5_9BACL
MRNAKGNEAQLDHEWVELIGSARSMGLSMEEIRQFLKQANQAAVGLSYALAFGRQHTEAMQ